MTTNYQTWFEQLTAVLEQNIDYWKLVAFDHTRLPWRDTSLVRTLNELSDQDVELIDQSPARQQQLFQQYFPDLFDLPSPQQHYGSGDGIKPLPFWLTNGIAGRKLHQIEELIKCLPNSRLCALEWCAGKGHLGRILSFSKQQPVVSVEWQQSLCEAGRELSHKHQVAQRFVQADVLEARREPIISSEYQVVALHACGDLHTTLLSEAVSQKAEQIHLVPCCYHLIAGPQYSPLSAEGNATNLNLSRHDLKLAVQGQVTAGSRVARLRHTEVSWRLAWQVIYEEITGEKDYRPLNSVAKHWFTGNFPAFAEWAAKQHNVTLPGNIEWSRYLNLGERRLQVVKRIELVRHLFRRSLELWLVLDKVLYLEAAGYEVELHTFCDVAATPRNLLIQAYRTSSGV